MPHKRENVATWEQTFMNIANVIKERSKDPIRQVGACIVSEENKILSLGYNGAPNGFDDDDFPWNREGDYTDSKLAYVVHAERNAVLNFSGRLRDFENSTVYVTDYPCNECAKELAQIKIKEIVYLRDPKWERENFQASKIMLEKVGIICRKYDQEL